MAGAGAPGQEWSQRGGSGGVLFGVAVQVVLVEVGEAGVVLGEPVHESGGDDDGRPARQRSRRG